MGNEKAINDKSLKKILKDKSLSISLMREKKQLDKLLKVKHIDELADRLVRLYGAEGSRRFFLKCYWHLDEQFIDDVVEKSQNPKIKSPLKYFVSSCHNEMIKIGL